MKLEEFKKDSYEFSGKASALVRQFAFAGIGLVWIFKYGDEGDMRLPKELVLPLFLLAITLMLDLFQYVIPSLLYSRFYKKHENKGRSGDYQIKAPKWYPVPGDVLYYSKIVVLFSAYILIIRFLIKAIATA